MYHPNLEEFLKLTKKGNVIPVYKEINADLDTPVSSFLKIKKDEYSFLLESVEGQEKIARFSFIGTKPSLVIKTKGRDIYVLRPREKGSLHYQTKTDPLNEIKKIMRGFNPVSINGLPRFCGGLVGYLGYDMVRFFEAIPDKNKDELNLNDAVFMLTDTLLVFDHVKHTIKIVSNIILPQGKKPVGLKEKKGIYNKALRKINGIHKELSRPLSAREIEYGSSVSGVKVTSNYTPDEFMAMVSRAKRYIRRGDIIQVVPSQRFKAKLNKEPFSVYRSLRSLNPSPYMFFLKLGDLHLIGSSPEILVRCEDGLVVTRPIAGTRPRGKDEGKDGLLEKELLACEKERAEHTMLVDLGRNDLGRVCRPGTVRVSEFMKVERYSHVMHLVSEVSGKLDTKYDVYDVLRATFPAGTVSGSPKIRAMEIIDELENTRRGPYAGSVGYFSFSHNMDMCITIRTIVRKGKTAYIQAGGGIVADSKPDKEYLESCNKASALIEAMGK